ncbi:hypothetical protein A2U01_0055382, partial [Trifolium medium]|nr:hypothetical protein [Trifolium medium]
MIFKYCCIHIAFEHICNRLAPIPPFINTTADPATARSHAHCTAISSLMQSRVATPLHFKTFR